MTLLAQICRKRKLEFEIQKTNVGIRISIFKIPCVPSDKMDNLEVLGPNLRKNGFWGQNLKNLSLDSESASLRYLVRQFSDKTDNFEFWGDFGVGISKIQVWIQNKHLHVCHFSVKMDNFYFFGLNLGKLPNYVQYFGSNIVEGVAESWMEADISWVELGARF